MRSYIEAKAMAKSLRRSLAERDVSLGHSECLEIVARQFGFRDWNILASKIELNTGYRAKPQEAPGIAMQPAIPVIRVSSSGLAKTFYAGHLGFRFGCGEDHGSRPLYAQISRSRVTLHLSEHGQGLASVSGEFLVRMTRLDVFHDELTRKPHAGRQPILRETPDDRRELARLTGARYAP